MNTKSKSGATQAHSLKTGRHVIGLMKCKHLITSSCTDFKATLTTGERAKWSFRKSRGQRKWCEYLQWAIYPTIQNKLYFRNKKRGAGGDRGWRQGGLCFGFFWWIFLTTICQAKAEFYYKTKPACISEIVIFTIEEKHTGHGTEKIWRKILSI